MDVPSAIFTPEHDELRAAVRRFVDKELAPSVDEWEEAARYLFSQKRDPNPAHVTYVRDMPFEQAVDNGPDLRPGHGAGLSFPLLSDVHRDTIRAYGVLDQERNVAYRSTFVVDRDGVLRWGQSGDRQMVRDGAEVLRVLDVIERLRRPA